MAGISEGEVAVYDRQLRLWGVQAQQRLLKARVLVWGLEGCNIEVCKNLVLAGVSLVIRDHRTLGPADVAFNYFLREEDLGKNRAECAAVRVQEMNPLCSVTSSAVAPGDGAGLKAELEGCHVVCLALGVVGFDVARACAVDAVCREMDASFLMTLSAGELAFFFANLNNHTVQERSSAQGSAGAGPEDAAPPEPETFDYPSLKEWLSCSPLDLQKRKVDDSILFIALFLAFAQSCGQAPAPGDGGKFADYCRAQAKCTPNVDGFSELERAYECIFLEPLMHVASVAAGLLAQEVIKAITKRDLPLVNTVCFNAHTSAALVERIPAAKAVKRKAVEMAADILDDD